MRYMHEYVSLYFKVYLLSCSQYLFTHSSAVVEDIAMCAAHPQEENCHNLLFLCSPSV